MGGDAKWNGFYIILVIRSSVKIGKLSSSLQRTGGDSWINSSFAKVGEEPFKFYIYPRNPYHSWVRRIPREFSNSRVFEVREAREIVLSFSNEMCGVERVKCVHTLHTAHFILSPQGRRDDKRRRSKSHTSSDLSRKPLTEKNRKRILSHEHSRNRSLFLLFSARGLVPDWANRAPRKERRSLAYKVLIARDSSSRRWQQAKSS